MSRVRLPREKWSGPTNGCKIIWSEPACEREITKVDPARQLLHEEIHQYTTSGSLPLPEKSQCFAIKRLLRKKESLFRKYSQTIHVNQPAHKTKSEE